MISKFVNKDECLILDIFIISKDRFILQFYNKNDLILNDYKTCKLTFSNDLYDHYSILETSLNTIDKFEKLVQFITEEPDDENDKLRSFKYSIIIKYSDFHLFRVSY